LIIPQMTAIADFKQRWRQRGKTPDCSFKQIKWWGSLLIPIEQDGWVTWSFRNHSNMMICSSRSNQCWKQLCSFV